MKAKIKYTTLLLVLLTAVSPCAMAENSTVAVKAGYVSRHETASAGLMFRYRFTPAFAIAPSIDYIFRHNNYDGLMLNVDGHFPLPFSTSKVEFYPLVGVNFSSWSNYIEDAGVEDDTTRRVSRWGLNAGAGAAIYLNNSMRLGLEAKYVGVKGNNAAVVTFSIGYNF